MLALKFIVRDEGRFVMTNLDLRLYYSKVHIRTCYFVQPVNKASRAGLKPPTFISPRKCTGNLKTHCIKGESQYALINFVE